MIDIGPQQLGSALRILQRQASIEILYDQGLVRGVVTSGARGRLTSNEALSRLLGGTGLVARRGSSGTLIVERETAEPLEAQDAPVPEILVVGPKTQNVEIRRLEDDVQPYRVTSGEMLRRAQRDNIDQYFRSRVTTNTQAIPPSSMENGETISEIDMRGLGSELTLVLVDGRRLPSIPQTVFGLRQPDLNAIPIHSVERIETLTGTSGGIHGFGALGGAVNVVLKRDYEGLELNGTAGISSRGDAGRISIQGGFGFTPNDGRTNVMFSFGLSHSDPLETGGREFMRRNDEQTARFAPDIYIANLPTSNSIGVFNFFGGEELVFRPDLGGGSLGSDHSFLPAGFGGDPEALASELSKRAGQLDFELASGEAASGLGSQPRTMAFITSVRHRFSADVEAFVDAFRFDNRGRHVSRQSNGSLFLLPGSPLNPFEQFVMVTFPVPGRNSSVERRFTTNRVTAGIVAGLWKDWRGTAEATAGSVKVTEEGVSKGIFAGPLFEDPSNPAFNPFGEWHGFQESLTRYFAESGSGFKTRNRYHEQSLRLAGPLFQLAGQPALLTLSAQHRMESIPRSGGYLESDGGGSPSRSEYDFAERSSRTGSLHGELRAPLVPKAESAGILAGLEVQLAVRADRQKVRFSRDPLAPELSERLGSTFSAITYTAGAKFNPLSWLTLRGSYSTGEIPPPLGSLIDAEGMSGFSFALDPKRGDRRIGSEGAYLARTQGSPDLDTVKANTLSFGMVAKPLGEDSLRLALDYSRIRKSGDVLDLGEEIVIEHEERWPERVTRAPLTDVDRALGFSAGRVLMIDSRAMNGAGRRVNTIDASFDWPLPFLGGTLRLYGLATHQLGNETWGLFTADVEQVGHYGGPLKWRANGGFDWSSGPLVIGANGQFFGRYFIYPAGQPDFINELVTEIQGARKVPSQFYLDLYASRRFKLGGPGTASEARLDIGIVNLLDKEPPRESSFTLVGPGYSRYGDPRLRRFEMSFSLGF